MVKFIKSIKKKIAEAKLEKKKISVANKIIQQRARTAALQERQKQAIKFAIEREKLRTKVKLQKLKASTQPRPRASVGFGAGWIKQSKKRIKKGKKRRTRQQGILMREQQPQRESSFFDISNAVP